MILKEIMKRVLFVLMISMGFLATSSCHHTEKEESRADEKNVISVSDVPAPVTGAFQAKYPQATEVIWEKAHEKDMDTYKVKFKQDSVYLKAEFSNDGNLIKEKKDD